MPAVGHISPFPSPQGVEWALGQVGAVSTSIEVSSDRRHRVCNGGARPRAFSPVPAQPQPPQEDPRPRHVVDSLGRLRVAARDNNDDSESDPDE